MKGGNILTRHPSKNPYWHKSLKPVAIDRYSTQLACREAFEIVMATHGIEILWNADLVDFGENPDWSCPMLVESHQLAAEDRLSCILLGIASSYRALDDQLNKEKDFSEFKKNQINEHGRYFTNRCAEAPNTLRECCNKIIHADDFRPIYDNNSAPRDEGIWSMTGEIELSGSKGKNKWNVVFDVFTFLEAVLETLGFLANQEDSEVVNS